MEILQAHCLNYDRDTFDVSIANRIKCFNVIPFTFVNFIHFMGWKISFDDLEDHGWKTCNEIFVHCSILETISLKLACLFCLSAHSEKSPLIIGQE